MKFVLVPKGLMIIGIILLCFLSKPLQLIGIGMVVAGVGIVMWTKYKAIK